MLRHIAMATAALAATAIAASCSAADTAADSDATASETSQYSGWYRRSFEQSAFWTDDGDGPWWLTADGEAWETLMEHHVDGPGRGGRTTVRLTVEGMLSAPGQYGHLGAYARELTVERVIEIKPVSAEELDKAVQGFVSGAAAD